jgi:hypothetical protein
MIAAVANGLQINNPKKQQIIVLGPCIFGQMQGHIPRSQYNERSISHLW